MANQQIVKDEASKVKEIKAVKLCRDTQATSLDLSHHKLKLIPASVFELFHVNYLYLEGNLLEDVPLELCVNLTQLSWLDLRHNNLKSLPDSISLLRSLKHLLLEGNMIEELPSSLGMLTQLTGLNLKGNPLIYPSKNIIQQGVKTVLRYLREKYTATNRIEKSGMRENPHDNKVNESGEIFEESENTDSESNSDCNNNVELYRGMRRLSFQENLGACSEELPPLRRLNIGSAPVKRAKRPESYVSDISRRHIRTDVGYMRQEPIQSRYQLEILNAEKKLFNEKADAIIQKRIDKQVLKDWQRESAKLQRQKRFSKSSKHTINLPYGNELQAKSEIKDRRPQIFDEKLEQRIKEHVDNIREWREKDKKSLTVDEHLKVAKHNLNMAQQLHKNLKGARPAELPFNSTMVNDLAPPTHFH